jgi:DNA polymerase III delta prime subunit
MSYNLFMNGSILIFGGNKNQREEKIIEIVNKEASKTFEKIKDLNGKADIKIIERQEDEKSISISQTREGIRFMDERPFSYEKKFLIILDAEKLTTQAQNSLLKTLEEPPSFALILLSSKTQNSLLETIVSRCRMIPIKKDRECIDIENINSFNKILKMNLGRRLEWAGEFAKEEKETILEVLECWIDEARSMMIKTPKEENCLKNIKRIMEIRKDLEDTNVNQRLSLEALVVSFL